MVSTGFNPEYAIEKYVHLLKEILMRNNRKNRTMDFDISFVNKEITPWGGMVLLKQIWDKDFRATPLWVLQRDQGNAPWGGLDNLLLR
jgi:hypothetical protein